MLLELVPIGTLLAVLVTQILETAAAAQDVLIEKESFGILSKYLQDIQPLLADLRRRDMKDTPAARTALESLQEDLNKARRLVDKCTNKPPFYLLVNCRGIVKDAQQITRNLGKSIQLITLASSEVSVEIRNAVSSLKDQMINAEFHASESKLHLISKLEAGLREQRHDQGFTNDLIREIAIAVGVPVNASGISKELASLKREKEDAAERKEREEEVFMEQIISFLSRADIAYVPEDSRQVYYDRVGSLRKGELKFREAMSPLKSFVCPLKKDVMADPVSLVTGSCFERSFITQWFDEGNTTDPVTHEEISDRSLKSNILLRQSIEEWQERNFCIRILKAKSILDQPSEEADQKRALEDLYQLCLNNRMNKDWIAAEAGLVDSMINALKSHSSEVKERSLVALHILVTDNSENKEKVASRNGVEQIVRCLGREIRVAKAAATLLLELLDGSEEICARVGQERSSILLLVYRLRRNDPEGVHLAKLVLDKLATNDNNIIQMAAANWCIPLIYRLCEGGEEKSRVLMAKALASSDLTDESKTNLAERGAIPPLIRMMVSGKVEAKSAAMSALQNLSSYGLIKIQMVQAGAVPVILDYLFSGRSLLPLREAAAAILDNLALNDGVKYFVDADGVPVEDGHIIENLLAAQENSAVFPVIRRHILHTLLGLISLPDAKDSRERMMAMNGISMLLPLIGESDIDMRTSAIQILFHLSEKGGATISKLLQERQLFGALIKILGDSMRVDAQAAAAGILVFLPQNDRAVTEALLHGEVIPALFAVLRSGTSKAKEAAVGATLRFTDPEDIETQKLVANHGLHSILVNMLQTGTTLSKARAADALKNLSKSTPLLSDEPDMACVCFKLSNSRSPCCQVHCGVCDVKTTFCLVEADAVTALISLLNEPKEVYAGAAVDALATLVSDDQILQKGVKLLEKVGGVDLVIDLLSQGTPNTKEKALMLLERIFAVKEMKEIYGNKARIPLVDLASFGNNFIRKRAAKVLSELRFIHEVSASY